MKKDLIYYSTDSVNNFDKCSIKSNLELNILNSSSTQNLCLTIPSTSTNFQSYNSKHVNCKILSKSTSSELKTTKSNFCKYTVLKPTKKLIKTHRKVEVNSFSNDLAVAADSYFYFYSLNNSAKKCKPKSVLELEHKNSTLNQNCNQKYLKSDNFYLGSNYHEFWNKFITIRLCECCQKLHNFNKVDFNSNCYFFDKKSSNSKKEEDQFSQVSTIRIVDFSSNSSLLSNTQSTNSTENSYHSSFRNILHNLKKKTLSYQNHNINNIMIDSFNKSKF